MTRVRLLLLYVCIVLGAASGILGVLSFWTHAGLEFNQAGQMRFVPRLDDDLRWLLSWYGSNTRVTRIFVSNGSLSAWRGYPRLGDAGQDYRGFRFLGFRYHHAYWSTKTQARSVTIPFGALLLLFLAYPTSHWWRRRYRTQRGLCGSCGYDLTGNTSGRCSECGASA